MPIQIHIVKELGIRALTHWFPGALLSQLLLQTFKETHFCINGSVKPSHCQRKKGRSMTHVIKQSLISNRSQSWKGMGGQLKQQSPQFTTNKLFQSTVDLGFNMFLYEKHTFLLGGWGVAQSKAPPDATTVVFFEPVRQSHARGQTAY